MHQIDVRIFLLYVCLYFMLLHFHGNFGRLITSKNNYQNGYHHHHQQQIGFYPPYPSLYHTSVGGYWHPNSMSSATNFGFGFGTIGSNNPMDWQSHFHHQSAYWPPNNPFGNAYGYQKPFAASNAASHLKQQIVYDQMPDNEDTLFSSIVRILNAESDNPNWNLWQQKQQIQALRRLTARKLLTEGDALSGSGKLLLAAYIKDELREKRFGFPGVENSGYPYTEAALFRSYAAHMSASFGNGDHTKSGGVIEIMYAEKVLGRRILTIEV